MKKLLYILFSFYILPAKLTIYDILGREIAVLVNQQLKAGDYEVDWNASNYPQRSLFLPLKCRRIY